MLREKEPAISEGRYAEGFGAADKGASCLSIADASSCSPAAQIPGVATQSCALIFLFGSFSLDQAKEKEHTHPYKHKKPAINKYDGSVYQFRSDLTAQSQLTLLQRSR